MKTIEGKIVNAQYIQVDIVILSIQTDMQHSITVPMSNAEAKQYDLGSEVTLTLASK